MLSAFKNFGLTFLIAAVVFGAIAFSVTGLLINTMDEILSPTGNDLDDILGEQPGTSDTTTPPTAVPPTASPTEQPIEGESFNMLIVVSDTQPYGIPYPSNKSELQDLIEDGILNDEKVGLLSTNFRRADAVSMVLVRVDKDKRAYSFTALSSLMRASTPAGDMLLGDIYSVYGIDFLIGKIAALTGVTADKYVTVGSDDITAVAGEFEGITFNVPVDIYKAGEIYGTEELLREYEANKDSDKNAVEPKLVLSVGVQQLTAENIPALLMFEETSSATVSSKASISAGLAKAYLALVTQLTPDDLLAKFDLFADNELISTNITKDWIEDNMGIIAAYKDFDHPTVQYPASFKTETDDFGTVIFVQPNISNAVSIFSK